jgi:hypothetical protein
MMSIQRAVSLLRFRASQLGVTLDNRALLRLARDPLMRRLLRRLE